MRSLYFRTGWLLASGVLLLGILLSTLTPSEWIFSADYEVSLWFFDTDKWAHGATFAGLAIWFGGLWQRRSYWRIALGLLLYGALIELCQSFLPYRTAEGNDMLANVTGIAVGLAVAWMFLGNWTMRVEHWLRRKEARADG